MDIKSSPEMSQTSTCLIALDISDYSGLLSMVYLLSTRFIERSV